MTYIIKFKIWILILFYLFVNTLVAQLYVEQHTDKKVKSKGFGPE
jgi:uncharacterized membrane protein